MAKSSCAILCLAKPTRPATTFFTACGAKIDSGRLGLNFERPMHAQRGFAFTSVLAILAESLAVVSAASGNEYWNDRFRSNGIDLAVQAITTLRNDVYVAGIFSKAGEVSAKNIAKWDGDKWSALESGLTGGGFSALALAALDNSIYVGGTFEHAGNMSARNVARWDETNWSSLGEGINGIVRVLAAANGKLYAGGSFSMAGGVPTANVAVWDGEKWSALGQGLPGEAVDSLAVSETTVYAGGRFHQGAGVQATNIARWDGTDWKPLGKGIRASETFAEGAVVRALWLSGTNLYAGGGFGWAGDVRTRNVARWDGAQWAPLGGGVTDPFGEVYAFAEEGGNLYIGGGFLEVDGRTANYVAAWDGSDWKTLGSGLANDIGRAAAWALASNGTELFVGGSFTQAGGKPAQNLAVWQFPQTLQVVGFGEALSVSWPAPDTNFVLEATSSLTNPHWSPVPQEPVLQNYRWTVTNVLNGEKQFFRLRNDD